MHTPAFLAASAIWRIAGCDERWRACGPAVGLSTPGHPRSACTGTAQYGAGADPVRAVVTVSAIA
jgi:hypothetical protein